MERCASCSLEEEIMDILETDSPVTVRFLCAVLFPSRSWTGAQVGAAEAVRTHCRALVRRRLIAEVNEDLYTLACLGNA